MPIQCPISAPVRRQPVQYPSASSSQTLMQGDGGRSMGMIMSYPLNRRRESPPGVSRSVAALNYGGAWPILQTRPALLQCNQNKSLDARGNPNESAEQSSPLS